ncbi:MAG: sterol desaturase family protein [Vicinamibacterales bacterium]
MARRTFDSSFQTFKADQARLSRGRLYPLTVFYVGYGVAVLGIVLTSSRPWSGAASFLAGVPVWTLVEYLFHRYVLHGRFPKRESRIGRWLHDRLDPLHWEHHERPFDGLHISGQLSDLIGLFAIAAPVSWLFPVHTAPALLGGVVVSYVVEEWVHHSVHFYDFRNRYFRDVQKFHRYHHSHEGMELGYGLTSGIWDWVFGTQYPERVRVALFRRPPRRS